MCGMRNTTIQQSKRPSLNSNSLKKKTVLNIPPTKGSCKLFLNNSINILNIFNLSLSLFLSQRTLFVNMSASRVAITRIEGFALAIFFTHDLTCMTFWTGQMLSKGTMCCIRTAVEHTIFTFFES